MRLVMVFSMDEAGMPWKYVSTCTAGALKTGRISTGMFSVATTPRTRIIRARTTTAYGFLSEALTIHMRHLIHMLRQAGKSAGKSQGPHYRPFPSRPQASQVRPAGMKNGCSRERDCSGRPLRRSPGTASSAYHDAETGRPDRGRGGRNRRTRHVHS